MVTLIVCIVLGLISGYVANRMLYRSHGGLLSNCVVGAAGAVIGCYSYLYLWSDPARTGGVTVWVILMAIAGANLLLGIKQAVLGSRPVGT